MVREREDDAFHVEDVALWRGKMNYGGKELAGFARRGELGESWIC